ncbi:MAG: YkvA family protein [Bacteroidota bacterium]|nr:YkvA family protein [Bacteroidota bacterium]
MITKRLKVRPWMLKKEILILYYAFRDQKTPAIAKLPAVVSIIYLVSPFDLIPDFIPFVGYLDDIVIVPLLLNLAIRLLPAKVKEESVLKASIHQQRFKFLFFILLIFVIALLVGVFFLIRHFINK